MKTKKFLLMAAMLLTSMYAFAQSENNEPLKGDVNGDGKVDVADITAIVKIIMENGGGTAHNYTWYLGETEQESFTTADFNMTGTKPTVLNIGPSSGDKVTVWIYPQSWGKPTSIVDINNNDVTNVFIYNDSWMTVPSGYYGGWCQAQMGATLTLTWPETYYWYVGTELPTTSSNPSSNITTSNTTANAWHEIGTTLGSYSATNPLVNGSRNPININPEYDDVLYYICIPVGLGIYDGSGTNVAGSNTFPLVSGNITIAGKQYNIYSNVNSDFLGKVY